MLTMRKFICQVLLLLQATHAAKLHHDDARPQDSLQNRTRRDISCHEDLEYVHNGVCCLNCPAGTRVKSACLVQSDRGVCEACELGTYTEHDNGLLKCLQCTTCRPDQETTEKCTRVRNARCECKQGSFCSPDHACEVCKKCSRCKEDEEVVRSCTSVSNTVCEKTSSVGSSVTIILVVVALVVAAILLVSFIYWKKSKPNKRSGSPRSPRDLVKICMGEDEELRSKRENAHDTKANDSSALQPFLEQNFAVGTGGPASSEAERDRGLGDSLPNTANSSQISLVVCALSVQSNQPSSSATPVQPHTSAQESSRRLVPLNGEDSLKKTFDFFEEMDVHYHNRFFRFIGLSDNAIKSAETLFPEDRVYELLKVWMEKEGLKADFNCLIDALNYLDQRLSAENIISKAISSGYFKFEDE